MNYFIYGAGKRGKVEASIVGRENVVAFVDQDEEKVGTIYDNIPIINIDTLVAMKKTEVCIITPVNGRERIAESLRKMGVENCLLMQPFDHMLLYNKKTIFFSILEQYRDKNIGIYGISAGTLLLYDFLLDKIDKTVILIPDESEKEENYNFLKGNYKIVNLDDALQQVDVWIETVPCLRVDIKERFCNNSIYRKAQEIFEDSLSFYNPQIEKFKNVHLYNRCFIVATGPSLSIDDLEMLWEHSEICISMNRIYNIFNRTKWRPNYYMIEDTEMIEDLSSEIAALDLPVKFVPSVPECFWEQDNIRNTIQYQNVQLDNGNGKPLFSSKLERCIYEGVTVTYACIQMAVYMGFKNIYLLGVDFNYSNNLYDEKNHFPGYQSDKKIRLNAVSSERMEVAYISAKQYAEKNGIHIYNATRGGKLEVFERVEFDLLF